MTRYLYFIPLLAACALALAPDAGAQSCRRVVVSQPAVVAPAVVATPAVTVTTTGFLVTPQVAYPVLGASYGGDTAGEVRALREELAKLRAALTAPQATNGFARPAEKMPAAEGADAKLVAAVAGCVRCHGANSPKGGLSLAADNLGRVTREQWKEVFLRCSLPEDDPLFMPQAGKPVPDEVLITFAAKAKGK